MGDLDARYACKFVVSLTDKRILIVKTRVLLLFITSDGEHLESWLIAKGNYGSVMMKEKNRG